jgi:hypothetical protein
MNIIKKVGLIAACVLATATTAFADDTTPEGWKTLSDAELSRLCGTTGVEDATVCAKVATAELHRARMLGPDSPRYCINVFLGGLNMQMSAIYAKREGQPELSANGFNLAKQAFHFVIDQPCPYQYSSKAQHMLDLLEDAGL